MNMSLGFKKLPGKIHGVVSGQEFTRKFYELFTSSDASEAINVVYVWRTEKAIPRLREQSEIIYIGKTKSSLRRRHARYAIIEGSNLNWKRYEYIIKTYGPIWVEYKNVPKNADLREEEKKLLREYFLHHLEYPPMNQSF